MAAFTISKTFTFAASHQLTGLEEGHQCARLHGHNYEIDIELSGRLDAAGMVYDYGRLAPFRQLLDERYDHRHLNQVMEGNPTAENLAYRLFYEAFDALDLAGQAALSAIRVRETPRSSAEYRP